VKAIDRWLESHGLGKYAEVFAENETVLDVLDELKDLEIPPGRAL
jgi:hypothetical protein